MTDTTLETMAEPYFVAADQGQLLENIGVRVLANAELTGSNVLAVIVTNPGPGGPPMHTHFAHDEFYLVLEGRYRFSIGESASEGGTGSFAYVPRGISHTFTSIGPELGRLMAVTTPGSFSGFLYEMNELTQRQAAPEEVADLFRRYDSRMD